MEKNKKEILACPFRQTMEILEGKWKFPILHSLLKHGTLRYKELERDVIGITPRMLVKELKDLEKHKIVRRKAYATVPPTVEYSLTTSGKTLKPILEAIDDWGRGHFAEEKHYAKLAVLESERAVHL